MYSVVPNEAQQQQGQQLVGFKTRKNKVAFGWVEACVVLGCTRFFFCLAVFLDFGVLSSYFLLTLSEFSARVFHSVPWFMFKRFLILFAGRFGDGFCVSRRAKSPLSVGVGLGNRAIHL